MMNHNLFPKSIPKIHSLAPLYTGARAPGFPGGMPWPHGGTVMCFFLEKKYIKAHVTIFGDEYGETSLKTCVYYRESSNIGTIFDSSSNSGNRCD